MEAATAPPEDAIFDASAFDLPIPKDRYGRKADKLVIGFGAFELDRTSEDQLDVFAKLERGQMVELRIRVFVSEADESSREDEEGEQVTTIRRVLKVRGVEQR